MNDVAPDLVGSSRPRPWLGPEAVPVAMRWIEAEGDSPLPADVIDWILIEVDSERLLDGTMKKTEWYRGFTPDGWCYEMEVTNGRPRVVSKSAPGLDPQPLPKTFVL